MDGLIKSAKGIQHVKKYLFRSAVFNMKKCQEMLIEPQITMLQRIM